MGKPFKGFRFQPQLYADFMKIARSGGYTVTGAFEKFMSGCVEINTLVFPDRKILDSEAEARVLADWLDKGKHFYRTDTGEEVNIQGRLLWLLPKINDSACVYLDGGAKIFVSGFFLALAGCTSFFTVLTLMLWGLTVFLL